MLGIFLDSETGKISNVKSSKEIAVKIVAPMSPYTEYGGGTATSVTNIINRLDQNVDFTLLGVNVEDEATFRFKLHSAKFLGLARLKLKNLGNRSSIIYAWGIFRKRRLIDDSKSIIHVQRVDSALPLLYPVKTKSPVIVHIRGSNTYWKYLNKSLYFRFMVSVVEYLVVQRATKIIMVSKKGLNEYHKIYPKQRNKIIYIPNGVDIDTFFPIPNKERIRREFNVAEDAKILLYTGRFVREKGINLLLQSFEIIKKKMPDCLFFLIGDGPLKAKILEMKNQNNNIKVLNPLSNHNMPKIYAMADVLVMASYFEGWSNTLGEALACGLPVVTTDVGDAEEIIKAGINGYLIHNRDPKEFAEKCIDAISNCEQMRVSARESIMPYSLKRMASQLENVYRDISS